LLSQRREYKRLPPTVSPFALEAPNEARDERPPDSQAWPRRGDAEIKGRSAAESERSEDVRSREG